MRPILFTNKSLQRQTGFQDEQTDKMETGKRQGQSKRLPLSFILFLSLLVSLFCVSCAFAYPAEGAYPEDPILPITGIAEESEQNIQEIVDNYSKINRFTLSRMVISRLDLDITIEVVPFSEDIGTWDITKSTKAAYWLDGTPHPEYGGNTVIAAHYMEYGLPGPLFNVRKIEPGDEIILYSDYMAYIYKVERYQYVPEDYITYMDYRPYALTLFTCANFNWDNGLWESRVVVLANLDRIEPVSPDSR